MPKFIATPLQALRNTIYVSGVENEHEGGKPMLLEGIKIVDFSQYYPGPFASLRLQDWGATVVKVENPIGDPTRYYKPNAQGDGLAYRVLNRGKQSVKLNLKDEADHAKAVDLVKDADVVIEGFRPGVMKKLGLDYESVCAVNPDVVYCSITGYGQEGPLAMLAGHDPNYLAVSGANSQLLDSDGRPIVTEIALGDTLSGINASESILAGLVHRERTGEGSYFDISIAESVGLLQSLNLADVFEAKAEGRDEGNELIHWAVSYYVYETKDGRWVTLAAMEPKFWKTFCAFVGREDLVDQQNTLPEDSNPAYTAVKEIFASKTFAEWVEIWQSVDCCLGPVFNLDELPDSPLYQQRGDIAEAHGLVHMTTHYLEGGLPAYEKAYYANGENDLGL